MGNKIVTVPYESTDRPQSFGGVDTKDKCTREAAASNPHHNVKAFSSSSSQIPSECPMHQAKKEAVAGGCPIKDESDINPTNMVMFFYFYFKKLSFARIINFFSEF